MRSSSVSHGAATRLSVVRFRRGAPRAAGGSSVVVARGRGLPRDKAQRPSLHEVWPQALPFGLLPPGFFGAASAMDRGDSDFKDSTFCA